MVAEAPECEHWWQPAGMSSPMVVILVCARCCLGKITVLRWADVGLGAPPERYERRPPCEECGETVWMSETGVCSACNRLRRYRAVVERGIEPMATLAAEVLREAEMNADGR